MNKKKIISWVAFCIALVEFAKSDREIPTVSLQQNAAGADIIEITYRNRNFQITPNGRHFDFAGTTYPTLKEAAFAVVKSLNPSRTRPLADRFINRNVKRATMENGGMAAVCAALNLASFDAEANSFLIERYDLAVRTWGLAQ